MEIKELKREVEERLDSKIPDDTWKSQLIWFFCCEDAASMFDLTTSELAEMLVDGIKPKTFEHVTDYFQGLDEEDAQTYIVALTDHFEGVET